MRKADIPTKAGYVADGAILEGLISGDRKAVEGLYNTCYPSVARMVVANSGTEDEAKDVFQEAVLVLYDKVVQQKSFTLQSQLSTYLYAVSKRLWFRNLKGKGRFVSEGIPEENEPTDLAEDLTLYLEKEAQFEQMDRALIALGEPCCTILRAFYVEKQSMQSISESLGYTNADNAKNQKYKCLQRLKKLYFEGFTSEGVTETETIQYGTK